MDLEQLAASDAAEHFREYMNRLAEEGEEYEDYPVPTSLKLRAFQEQCRLRKMMYEATQAVRLAVQTGELTRLPCEVCGAKRTEAHHDDYARPLDVRFLYRKHHAIWHAKNGPGKNGADWSK
jgi:hypothetical protein